MFLRFLIISLTFSLFLSSCANITPPTGGSKDTIRPVLKSSIPSPGQTNFKGNTIELQLSERVMVQNIEEQLLITPYLEIPYKTTVRKNKVKLDFQHNLPDSTTFTFNFRDAIKDETEGNPANISLAFSTGPYIDSLSVSGFVKEILTGKTIENVLVSVYPQSDSFPAAKQKPLYFARTSKAGSFYIPNMKNAIYDLYAFEDLNKNFLFNEDERLAYTKGVDLSAKSAEDILLKISKFDSKPPEVSNVKEDNQRMDVNLSEGAEIVKVKSDPDYAFYPSLSENGKTLYLFKGGNYKDTIYTTLELTDSSGHSGTEKVKVIFETNKKEEAQPLTYSVKPSDGLVNPDFPELSISFNKPIVKINYNKLKIKGDTIIEPLKEENVKTISPIQLEIHWESKAKDSIFLITEENAFQSIDSSTHYQKIKFQPKKEENYALLEITIKTDKPNYVIELLNEKFVPQIKFDDLKKFTYTYLDPGSYYLRAIIDTNNNGKWDPGDLEAQKQPEDIILFENKIDLRANWEVRDIVFEF